MSTRSDDDTARRADPRGILPEPVLLVGSERSGSTLLRLMLDHHPEIAFEKEFEVVTHVSDTGELPPVQSYVQWVESDRAMDFEVDPSLSYVDLANDFLRQKRESSGGKDHVGATVHRHFDRLRFIWPGARYVHLVRDPRDVARSVVQKGWAGNVYQASSYWIQAEDCWDSLAAHVAPDRAIEVRYEDLVTRPESELGRICEFIGVEFSPEMLDYQSDARQYPPPDPKLASQWRTKLSRRDAALVESRLGERMESRGYPRSADPPVTVGRLEHLRLLSAARLRSFRNRIDSYGPGLATIDLLGRRLRLRALGRRARARMNAIDQAVIDEETAGYRAPSANIAPVGPLAGAGTDPGDDEHPKPRA